jgi:hypothetical protein
MITPSGPWCRARARARAPPAASDGGGRGRASESGSESEREDLGRLGNRAGSASSGTEGARAAAPAPPPPRCRRRAARRRHTAAAPGNRAARGARPRRLRGAPSARVASSSPKGPTAPLARAHLARGCSTRRAGKRRVVRTRRRARWWLGFGTRPRAPPGGRVRPGGGVARRQECGVCALASLEGGGLASSERKRAFPCWLFGGSCFLGSPPPPPQERATPSREPRTTLPIRPSPKRPHREQIKVSALAHRPRPLGPLSAAARASRKKNRRSKQSLRPPSFSARPSRARRQRRARARAVLAPA